MASQLAEQLGVIQQTMPEAGAGLLAGGKNYLAGKLVQQEQAARADEAAAAAEQKQFENALAVRRDARAEQTAGLQADRAEREAREAELEDLAKRASAARTPALWKQAQDSGFLPKELGFESREPIVMSALTVKAQKDLENQDRSFGLQERKFGLDVARERRLATTGEGGLTVRDQKIAELLPRVGDRNLAADLVDGRVAVTTPDQFGNVYTINKVTGEKRLMGAPQAAPAGAGAPQMVAEAPQATAPPAVAGPNIAAAAAEGTGPVSYAQDLVSNVIGWASEGQLFPKNAKARQQLDFFSKAAEEALVNNPRFPVAEQQFVRGLLPTTKQVFLDPDDAVSRLTELKSHLETKISANEASIASGRITTKREGELSNQNDNMRRVLSLMGNPSAPQGASRAKELRDKVLKNTATDAEIEEYLGMTK